ncbi:arsenite efflux transporter metallochaperone ArsD [Spirochaeta dissipatitropha]
MKNIILQIYDPALCCSSGVCGPEVDPALAAFAGTLKAIPADAGISVERYNLGQQPQAFVDNPKVKALLTDPEGSPLPYILIDGELVCSGRYPERKEIFNLLGLDTAAAAALQNGQDKMVLTDVISPKDSSCCSGSEGCC